MKHIWDAEELATQWRLSFEEMQLLQSKTARNHLPLVAQLKYYRYAGRFPGVASDITPTVLPYLADQVGADVNHIKAYEWSGRTGTRHRREILHWISGRCMRTDIVTRMTICREILIRTGKITIRTWVVLRTLSNLPTI